MCVCVYHLSFGECLFANTALLLPTLLIFAICSVAYLHSDGNFYIQMFLCWFIFLGWMDPGDCPQQTHDSIWHSVRRMCFFLTSDLVQSCEEWLFSSETKEIVLDVWQIDFKSACALFACSFALSILLISELNWLNGRCMGLNLLLSGLRFRLRKMRSYRVKRITAILNPSCCRTESIIRVREEYILRPQDRRSGFMSCFSFNQWMQPFPENKLWLWSVPNLNQVVQVAWTIPSS